MKEKEQREKDGSCGCFSSCKSSCLSCFDIEKLLFPIFFSHYRDLKREDMLLSWFLSVTLPFYASVALIYWFFEETVPMHADPPMSRWSSYAVDLMFTFIVPMTVLSFSHGIIDIP